MRGETYTESLCTMCTLVDTRLAASLHAATGSCQHLHDTRCQGLPRRVLRCADGRHVGGALHPLAAAVGADISPLLKLACTVADSAGSDLMGAARLAKAGKDGLRDHIGV